MSFEILASMGVFVLYAVSGSMEPTMHPGTAFTVDCSIPLDALKEGDIIFSRVPDPVLANKSFSNVAGITHRIVDIDHFDNGTIKHITTKGDNKETNKESIEGIDLTDNVDREQLKQLYIGRIELGEHLPETDNYTPLDEILGLKTTGPESGFTL